MRGLFILLLFQTLGEVGSRVLGLPLPGSVIGMFLLLGTLMIIGHAPEDIDKCSQTLIQNLGLLLIPAATGFGYYLIEVQGQILPIAVAASLGTVLTILFTALLMNKLIQRNDNHG